MKLEYAILQQKTPLHWLKEGDVNSKYFHAVIKRKKKRMLIHKIRGESGECIQGDENIARQACENYQYIFTSKSEKIRENILQCIPNIITPSQNSMLEGVDQLWMN